MNLPMPLPPIPSTPPPPAQPDPPTPPTGNGIMTLFGSKKGVVMVVLLVGCFTALIMGRVTWEQIATLLEVTVPSFFAADAITRGAEHVSKGMAAKAANPAPTPPTENNASVSVQVDKQT